MQDAFKIGHAIGDQDEQQTRNEQYGFGKRFMVKSPAQAVHTRMPP